MKRRGFTLLEVMVSLSILALALTAVAGINANSFESSNYARSISVATMLARSKMIDMEMMLQDDGFTSQDQEESGDFSEEGFEGMKWTAVIRPIEVDIGQLLGGFLGGDVSEENLPDQMASFLQGVQGVSPDENLNQQAGSSDFAQLLGGGQMEGIFEQFGKTLKDSIREITIEITWGREGIDQESVKFVQYVTTTGRLSVPNFGAGGAPGVTPGGTIPGANPSQTGGTNGGNLPGGTVPNLGTQGRTNPFLPPR